jgi:phenylalanine-4-hydroxylase
MSGDRRPVHQNGESGAAAGPDRAAPAPLEQIPPHLRIYLSRQDYSLYTPMDHAAWRFIMRVGRAFFSGHAHATYLDGLRETGISVERIPRLEEMDTKLRRFGWRAVPVIGFIPPAAFLEFQSLGLLPIACGMRQVEHLDYTPAPDIVHEAAGHAPLIADPAYATYLRAYGEVSRRAIFSRENMAVYFAIRRLSDTKERPDATPAEIAEAERELEIRLADVTADSEVDWVTRLGWWTTEYGLVGSIDQPRIYGAGLLSSIGESFHCLSDRVRKIPLTLDCIHQPFNITEPQPQLFVTPDFETLNAVLAELAGRMAFRRGGLEGLATARRGGTVCTVELDSGLQVSGVVSDYAVAPGSDGSEEAIFLRFAGPVMLAAGDRALPEQGPARHSRGFSSPLGRVRGVSSDASYLTRAELEACGFRGESHGRLEFDSGITLEGILAGCEVRAGRNLVLTFHDCTVRHGEDELYRSEWGPFDLACGGRVESVFGGAADRDAWMVAAGEDRYEPGTHQSNLTAANRERNELYARVREIREAGRAAERTGELAEIAEELDRVHPDDWLLRWELLELDRAELLGSAWVWGVRSRLAERAAAGGGPAESIDRGLRLLDGATP